MKQKDSTKVSYSQRRRIKIWLQIFNVLVHPCVPGEELKRGLEARDGQTLTCWWVVFIILFCCDQYLDPESGLMSRSHNKSHNLT